MPELPQMQALAERLHARLRGGRFEGADALGFTALKTVVPAPDSLVGATLRSVGRRAKYLVFDFGPGETPVSDSPRLIVHLGQAGRLDIEAPPKRTRPKGSAVRLRFSDPTGSVPETQAGEEVALLVREHGTERKAAWWVLVPGDDGPLERLGPEPDSDEFAELVLHGDDRRRVHTLLRDQRTVSGVGRGYADDALWRAQLSPYSSLGSLDEEQRARLLAAVRGALADGIALERGREGGLSQPKLGGHFEVHARHGTACPRCGETMRRVSYESHDVTYCPVCQTGGTVLADRRLSRLVK